MSTEQKFKAAVNVIRGLPKNGSYQPSHDMMLRFYAYFKQSTEGSCKGRRPAFWDIVGRAKYDAWKRLGEMPKEKAMESYVDELRKIVETMSYTENVADFYGSIDECSVSLEDLQLVAPAAIEKARSNPNSPLHSRETSPMRNDVIPNGYVNGFNHSATDTSDDDEYIDTVEDEIPVVPIVDHMTRQRDRKLNYSQQNGGIHKKNLPMTEVTNTLKIDPSMLTHLVQITDKMKVDLQQVNNRMNVLEQKIVKAHKYPKWWPFEDISPYWFSFTVIWPVVVAIVFRTMQQNKLNHHGKRS
ncbi:CLUMA_CG009779, isoform A [Clunio marinus]|uniref:CLUMA_CG009779, isoform A n=1 Tax=Clunio marinus TaxID=568069 RepID=A0A1J1I9F0_9DIPT|nr:CLUMA_CG009779, isoform A [Clunio marinus]